MADYYDLIDMEVPLGARLHRLIPTCYLRFHSGILQQKMNVQWYYDNPQWELGEFSHIIERSIWVVIPEE